MNTYKTLSQRWARTQFQSPLLREAGAYLSTTAAAERGEGNVRDTIIIGSGPAGYTAALYAARANLRPLVIAGYQHGGQLQLTSDVENFPGYVDPISGPDLMEDLMNQAKRFGAEILFRDATSVDTSTRPFRITSRRKEYRARSLILATGAEAIWLNAKGEEGVKGRGVSTCATCDGAFFKEKEVGRLWDLGALERSVGFGQGKGGTNSRCYCPRALQW
ncbi:unnamed protein product [Discosporangium mesarthrocarpum]